MLTVHVTSTRNALGALRLPWCVDRATKAEPIRIADELDRIQDALQLRVRDVEDARVREALRKQIAKGESSLVKIESIVTVAEEIGRCPQVEDSEAFRIGGDLTLMEGCHRTCAIYLFDPPTFELRTLVVPDDQAWPVYFDSGLRVA